VTLTPRRLECLQQVTEADFWVLDELEKIELAPKGVSLIQLRLDGTTTAEI
jgi:hypothetical protein